MNEIFNLSLLEVKEALIKHDLSALEVTNAFIEVSENIKNLNVYNTFTPEKAIEMAKLSQSRIDKGQGKPLDGIPIAVKDLFCTEGILTTASSKILNNFQYLVWY